MVARTVDLLVTLERLEVGDHLRVGAEGIGESLLDGGGEPVGVAELRAVREQQVQLDDEPLSRLPGANRVVLNR